MPYVEENSLYLFAVNTGSLYPKSIELAKRRAHSSDWKLYILGYVLPAYRRDCREPLAMVRPTVLKKIATDLEQYYLAHVAENGGAT